MHIGLREDRIDVLSYRDHGGLQSVCNLFGGLRVRERRSDVCLAVVRSAT